MQQSFLVKELDHSFIKWQEVTQMGMFTQSYGKIVFLQTLMKTQWKNQLFIRNLQFLKINLKPMHWLIILYFICKEMFLVSLLIFIQLCVIKWEKKDLNILIVLNQLDSALLLQILPSMENVFLQKILKNFKSCQIDGLIFLKSQQQAIEYLKEFQVNCIEILIIRKLKHNF